VREDTQKTVGKEWEDRQEARRLCHEMVDSQAANGYWLSYY